MSERALAAEPCARSTPASAARQTNYCRPSANILHIHEPRRATLPPEHHTMMSVSAGGVAMKRAAFLIVFLGSTLIIQMVPVVAARL